MDEHNTLKAIIFCLDKHEIYPPGNNGTGGRWYKKMALVQLKIYTLLLALSQLWGYICV